MKATLQINDRLVVETSPYESREGQLTVIKVTGANSVIVRYLLNDAERKCLIGFLSSVPDERP